MTARSLLGALTAAVLVAGCGASGDEPPAGPPTNGAATSSAAGGPEPQTPASGDSSPFNLSVLGPEWKVPAKPFEPAPPRPSDCAELDRLTADFRAWATTQRQYRVEGLSILEVNAKAPDAGRAAAFLDRQSKFMLGCSTVRYPTGGFTRIQPASSRMNQTGYDVQDGSSAEQDKTFTIKGPWIIEVTVLEAAKAPPQLMVDIASTLLEQSRA
ncbi:MAG: hypothetical protein AVDCRST_MAG76-143 [uncultured Acidimicrobiales bacterium]|uniref:PknH-like extracellular domain-containing protein n=1 Tax=uncultured Acidimicrobiales bacterium TaxID=310071 RepID=A0A6J4H2Q9_9ACTN|nr:MAG: hypothetical protein AVDCRST_MAG76-143 [uncultured Acidimicrobiales bacterium]